MQLTNQQKKKKKLPIGNQANALNTQMEPLTISRIS